MERVSFLNELFKCYFAPRKEGRNEVPPSLAQQTSRLRNNKQRPRCGIHLPFRTILEGRLHPQFPALNAFHLGGAEEQAARLYLLRAQPKQCHSGQLLDSKSLYANHCTRHKESILHPPRLLGKPSLTNVRRKQQEPVTRKPYPFVVNFQVRCKCWTKEWQLPVSAQGIEEKPETLVDDSGCQTPMYYPGVATNITAIPRPIFDLCRERTTT